MGFQDRDYVRARRRPAEGGGVGTLRVVSFNTWLIIINVLVFVADGTLLSGATRAVLTYSSVPQRGAHSSALMSAMPQSVSRAPGSTYPVVVYDAATGVPVGQERWTMMTPLQRYGHFSTKLGFLNVTPNGWIQPQVWRFVTFQFLHANVTHLFFNMFGLWIFGGMVEQFLGFKRYAAFYLACGVFGAVAYLVLNLLGQQTGMKLPGVLVDNPYTPLVGASAGVFGVIMACAYIAPNAVVQLLFPPIPMKLKFMAYGYVALALFNLLRGGQNAGGDAAHMGGAIAGFFFIRNSHLLRDFFDVFGDSRRGRPKMNARQDLMDRILEKVSTQGLGSLTEGERAVLKRAGEKKG